MRLKHPLTAAVFAFVTAIAVAGITVPAQAVTAGPVTFQFRTLLDASPVGGSAVTPLRIIYQYDPGLSPGSGPFGSSGDGTYESYGPLNKMIVELGDQCVAVSGNGTSTTVFNNAGGTEDSFDIRADGAAVDGKTLYKRSIRFMGFLLVDGGGTMLNSTALPTSPVFVEESDFQQTSVEVVDSSGVRTSLEASAPYFLTSYDPVGYIGAVIDQINDEIPTGGQVTTDLKTKLIAPLQRASKLLADGLLVKKNNANARGSLDDFIKLVHSNRNRLGASNADSLTSNAQAIIAVLPACT
jgi:hypothetical protein